MTDILKLLLQTLAAISVLETRCKRWRANRELAKSLQRTVGLTENDYWFISELAAHTDRLDKLIPRRVPDADEIAQYWYGESGILLPDLMLSVA